MSSWNLLPEYLPGLKLKGRTTKYILKEALRGILPDEVLFREKMGFGVPIDHWFRNELKDMAYDTLTERKELSQEVISGKNAVKRFLMNTHQGNGTGIIISGIS